ncbi:follistatin-related protein 5-like isoform X3 [Lycorma delicatula]|uniref:follistatin-related protein 5-like isoform X3 n=1 Tax=Lycorma delicatula TaxID=130591 RepID=UPI003F50F8CD
MWINKAQNKIYINRTKMQFWRTVLLVIFSASLILAKRSRHHREGTTESPVVTSLPYFSSTILPSLGDDDYHEDLSSLTEQNPCLVHYCGKGRECRVIAGSAQCVCQRHCRKHQKVVCGSDGRLYDNHCELHRTACLTNTLIVVDHTFACLTQDGKFIPTKSNSSNSELYLTVSTENNDVEPQKQDSDQYIKQQSSNNVSTEQTPYGNPEENEADSDLYYDKEDCTLQEYEIMKDNLLLLHHAKLMAEDSQRPGKQFLVGNIFQYYDLNRNGFVEADELEKISQEENMGQLAKGCTLQDMVSFEDADKDGKLIINEFYTAFSLSVVSLDKALEVNHLSARVGDNVEIKCDVSGTPPPPIVWRRNTADLSTLGEDEVRVFSDGSLYLTRIQLVHAGNYTCHAQRNRDVTQTHVLTVHTIPEVKVTPRIQSRRPGEEAAMFCHVIGEPFPKVEWLKNDEPLKLDTLQKYDIIGNGTELRIHNIGYADTGAYMCQAVNVGGMTRDISSLIVQEDPTPTAPNEERRFFSFHDWGVSVYEPTACRLYHQIQSTDIIPGTQEYVCGDKGVNCSWGQAINVANRYVYVSQPMKDRVLVISKIQMVVVDVVVTDKNPVALHYVKHLDQVWVLNWRSLQDEGVKTIQVIRDAAQKKKHHTVHPEPIDGQFDLVRDLFMPPVQDMSHMFKYGYVSHTNQRGLYKLDLANMRYIRSIDLTPYNCVPRSMQFSALYGFVIVECEEPMTGRPTGQILLDYLTDAVISQKAGLLGRPAVTPNSRVVVTLDRASDGVTLVVQQVTETGLKFVFDVKTTLNISDMTFYPSQTTHGYDLYASAVDKEDILFLNLVTGKVEMITGVGKAMHPSLAQWGNPNRPIAASGVFGHYMVTPANEALFVVNGETRTVNCEIGGLVHPRAVVWVTMQLQ